MTLTKLTTYTYRLSKRPLTNYGFQFNKDENHLPQITGKLQDSRKSFLIPDL